MLASILRRSRSTGENRSGAAAPREPRQPAKPAGRNLANREIDGRVTLFLAGDVMTGRGIDQVLPHPGDPKLYERYVANAGDYVQLAKDANGPIPKPVDFDYVWGEAAHELEMRRPDARVVNLETAITACDQPLPKGINYRMSPENIRVLTALGVDCCILANNHVLDWGRPGLVETLETLERAGIRTAGAGRDRDAAFSPARLSVPGGRILVYAFASETSGVPADWAVGPDKPGVDFLADLSPARADAIGARIKRERETADIVVASIHWGANWGYQIPPDQRSFAHALIDRAGVDIVFGHSSHHPKGMEVHGGKLILYGAGDFLNDYEGITGYEQYRDDLVIMYLPSVRLSDGRLERLDMIPFQLRKFRLRRAGRRDARWLCERLDSECRKLGANVRLQEDSTMTLQWPESGRERSEGDG